MENTAVASLMQWGAQPLSDKFLSKKSVKVGLEFEVFYDDPYNREDEGDDYDDEYANEDSEFEPEDDDDEARASASDTVAKVNAVHIPDSTTHAVREFYRQLATEFYSLLPNETIISMAPDYNYYRKLPGKYSGWNFAYDSSIKGGFPVEVISPIMDVSDNLEGKLTALWTFFTRTSASTNESTGLHVTISSSEGTKNFNPLVFAILSGDEYLLDKFSRLEAEYAKNSTEEIKEILEQQGYLNAEDEDGTIRDDLDAMLTGTVGRTLLYRLPDHRQRSINLTKLDSGVIEYRGMGDDYLERTDAKELTRIIRRLASAFVIACDPMSLDNENLRKWLRKRLYLQLVEGYKTKDEYKAQFNGREQDFDTAPFTNKVEEDEVAGTVKLTAMVNGSNNLSGYITVRSSIFEIQSYYVDGKWELKKLVIAPKATETKESTINLAKVLRKYLVQLTRSGLPSDMRRDLYKSRLDKKKPVTAELQAAIKGTLDLGGRTVAQVVIDTILGEANKRLWRIAKTNPGAYKRSMAILKLQENEKKIESLVYAMPVLDNVRSFADRLSTKTELLGQMKYSIASEARVQLELANANYDFIDTVTALSLGVPLVLAVAELMKVMYQSASWAEANTRKFSGIRGAQQIIKWRDAARYLDSDAGILNMSKLASLAANCLVICGATGSDVISEETVKASWETLKAYLHEKIPQEYNTAERHLPQLLLMDPTVPFLDELKIADKLDELNMA